MVLYFSGTGNSRYAAQRIADALTDELLSINDRIKAEAGLSGAATALTVWRASAVVRRRPLSTAKRASGSPDIIPKENERCRQLRKPCLMSSI